MASAVPGKAQGMNVKRFDDPAAGNSRFGCHPCRQRRKQHAQRRAAHGKKQTILQRSIGARIGQIAAVIVERQQFPSLRVRVREYRK